MRCRLPSDRARRRAEKIKQISAFALGFITLVMRVHCKELLLNRRERRKPKNFSLKSIFLLKIWLILCHNNDRPLPNESTRGKIFVDFFRSCLCFANWRSRPNVIWWNHLLWLWLETLCLDTRRSPESRYPKFGLIALIGWWLRRRSQNLRLSALHGQTATARAEALVAELRFRILRVEKWKRACCVEGKVLRNLRPRSL